MSTAVMYTDLEKLTSAPKLPESRPRAFAPFPSDGEAAGAVVPLAPDGHSPLDLLNYGVEQPGRHTLARLLMEGKVASNGDRMESKVASNGDRTMAGPGRAGEEPCPPPSA
jgi:hypothetical protein